MKYNKHIVIIFLLFNRFCYAQNLVQDSSFENGAGQLSLQGWYRWGGSPSAWLPIDTSTSSITGHSAAQDVPPGGGTWSLQLVGIGNGGDYCDATYFITGQQGTAAYQLSVWAKCMIPAPYRYSNICLQKGPINDISDYVNSGFDTLDNKTLYLDSLLLQWKKYILIDTITTVTTDTIFVQLFGVGHIATTEKYRFDLVQLTKTGIVSTQNTLHLQPENIKIYPNPFTETATLRITNEKIMNYELKIFDIYGKEIKVDAIRNSEGFVIRRGELANGMYFYQLTNYYNGELLKHGKLVVQ